jgi:hypothetical protein
VIFGVVLAVIIVAATPMKIDLDRILTLGKRADVHRVDPALRSQTFESWMRELTGPGSVIEWDVNDCGEGPSEPPRPICLSADAHLAKGGRLFVSLLVADDSVGFAEPAALFYAAIDSVGPHVDVVKLSALPSALAHAHEEQHRLERVVPRPLDERSAIDSVRRTPANRFDRTLPPSSLDVWLSSFVSGGFQWTVEGCQRRGVGDAWAYVVGRLDDPRVSVVIAVRVGTCDRGVIGTPSIGYVSVYDKRQAHRSIHNVGLAALPQELAAIARE